MVGKSAPSHNNTLLVQFIRYHQHGDVEASLGRGGKGSFGRQGKATRLVGTARRVGCSALRFARDSQTIRRIPVATLIFAADHGVTKTHPVRAILTCDIAIILHYILPNKL